MSEEKKSFIPDQMPDTGVSLDGDTDLKPDGVQTLGSYLSAEIQNSIYKPATQPTEGTAMRNPAEGNTPAILTGGSKKYPKIDELHAPKEVTQSEKQFPPGFGNIFLSYSLESARSYLENISKGGDPKTRDGGTFSQVDLQALIEKDITGHITPDIMKKLASNRLATVVGDEWTGVASQGVKTPLYPDNLRGKISSVLQNNRFNPSGQTPYINDKNYSNGMYSYQNQFGRFQTEGGQLSGEILRDEETQEILPGKTVKFEELAAVGLSLMLRATGDTDPKLSDKDDAIFTEGAPVQIGLSKVAVGNMRAESAVGAPQYSPDNQNNRAPNSNRSGILELDQKGIMGWGGFGNGDNQPRNREDSVLYAGLSGTGNYSHGVMNSPHEPFDPPLPAAMLILLVVAALTIFVAGIVTALLYELFYTVLGMGKEPNSATMKSNKPLPLGSTGKYPPYGGNKTIISSEDLMRRLGMPRFVSNTSLNPLTSGLGSMPFLNNFFVGTFQFFRSVAGGYETGFYVCVCRNAIRDMNQITDSFRDADWGSATGILGGAALLVESWSTSALSRFCCTMASLGDLIRLQGGLSGNSSLIFAPQPIRMSAAQPSLSNLHAKSRMKLIGGAQDDIRQALRASNLPQAFVIPDSKINSVIYMNRSAASGMETALSSETGKEWKNRVDEKGKNFQGRIPKSHVDAIEKQLDATYMPFYFHDLRTNEVISFHAFVESINDSFSPNWNASSGFGRMDPVQTYQSTTRKIGLTFTVAAMDREDFNQVWYQINRLVALVYPQWSRGTQRKMGDHDFIQPFSQVPTASPVIRLRLGDLIKSNYSKTNMSQLFGLGTDSFKIKGENPLKGIKEKVSGKLQEEINLLKARYNSNNGTITADDATLAGLDPSGLVPIDQGYQLEAIVDLEAGEYPLSSGVVARYHGKSGVRGMITQGVKCKVVGYMVDPPLPPQGEGNEDQNNSEAPAKTVRTVLYAVEPTTKITMQLMNSSDTATTTENSSIFLAEQSALSPDPKWISDFVLNKLMKDPPPIPLPIPDKAEDIGKHLETEELKAIGEFFSSEKNAIIRSFESAGGQGLAGVITNFDLDYGDSPWEIDVGSRAPQVVKITIGFSPIHDIPMGIDADGAMRSVAYPVGKVVQEIFGGPGQDPEWRDRQNAIASTMVNNFNKAIPKPESEGPETPPVS